MIAVEAPGSEALESLPPIMGNRPNPEGGLISAHYTTGDADILVHVAARNPRDLYRITRAILAIDGVARTSTALSLDEAISYRPHALLRVAAGSWRPPAA